MTPLETHTHCDRDEGTVFGIGMSVRCILAIVVSTILLQSSAIAAKYAYDGPISRRMSALSAFEQLLIECPRVKLVLDDLSDVKLVLSSPETPGLYGIYATVLEADTLVQVTMHISPSSQALPYGLIEDSGRVYLLILTSPKFSGFALPSKPSQWFCNVSPEPGKDVAALASASIGRLLGK